MESESKLDLSGQCLKRIPRNLSKEAAARITELHLDNNEIPTLENIHVFSSVVEFSASHNSICRMHNVGKLVHLVKLDLSYNHISLVDGLSSLVHLTYLNLANNRIKVVELKTNCRLEHLDLSENFIVFPPNLSALNNLKAWADYSQIVFEMCSRDKNNWKLFLHKNAMVSLKKSETFLPGSLNTLSLAGNRINDLNEIGHLVNLVQLRDLSIVSNPCVVMTGNSPGFDYRPFLVNWCTSLKCIDGFAVDEIESLKGEWLYSQGRGRKFQFGQHESLVEYLAETCPLNSQHLQPENERKLRLILSKAHHHQSQLRGAEGKQIHDPKDLMTRSLDSSLMSKCCLIVESIRNDPSWDINKTDILARSLCCDTSDLPLDRQIKFLPEYTHSEDSFYDKSPVETISHDEINKEPASYETAAPLPAASKLVPVPESLISPMVASVPPMSVSSVDIRSELSSAKLQTIRMTASCVETRNELSNVKLQTIRNTAKKRSVEKSPATDREKAAMCIQKHWRGYRARNLNPTVLSANRNMVSRRIYQHIQKLSMDMEATRGALDNDHKLQVLQMQAINALWRKVASLQPAAVGDSSRELKELTEKCDRLIVQVASLQPAAVGDSSREVKELTEKCDRLIVQVEVLQSSMEQILRCVNPPSSSVTATQTDSVAGLTPLTQAPSSSSPLPATDESVESTLLQCRPSTLPLRVHNQVSSQLTDAAPDSVDSCTEALGESQGVDEQPGRVATTIVRSDEDINDSRRCISNFF